jgi:hypothetical protein
MAKDKSILNDPQISGVTQMPFTSPRPECLLGARFIAPSTIDLNFADGKFSLAVNLLEMPLDHIRWETAAASPAGDAMTVEAIKGESISIDSSTLRYLVDKGYAAEIDASLEALQFTRAELKKMAEENPPPQEWYNQPQQDLRLDSWKQ